MQAIFFGGEFWQLGEKKKEVANFRDNSIVRGKNGSCIGPKKNHEK